MRRLTDSALGRASVEYVKQGADKDVDRALGAPRFQVEKGRAYVCPDHGKYMKVGMRQHMARKIIGLRRETWGVHGRKPGVKPGVAAAGEAICGFDRPPGPWGGLAESARGLIGMLTTRG